MPPSHYSWIPHLAAVRASARCWLRRRGHDQESADELWQQVVAEVLATRADPDPQRDPRAYLLAATRHAAGREERRSARRPQPLDDATLELAEDRGRTPTQRCIAEEQRRTVRRAVRALPLGFRIVVERRYLEGASVADVAEELAIAPGTVATRTHRALRLLGSRLARLGGLVLVGAKGSVPRLVAAFLLAALLGLHASTARALHDAARPVPPPPEPVPVPLPQDGLLPAPEPTFPTSGFPYGDGWVVRPLPEV